MTEHFERLQLTGGTLIEMKRRKRGSWFLLKLSALIAATIIIFLLWLFNSLDWVG